MSAARSLLALLISPAHPFGAFANRQHQSFVAIFAKPLGLPRIAYFRCSDAQL